MCINRRMDQRTMKYSCNGIPFCNTSNKWIDPQRWISHKIIILREGFHKSVHIEWLHLDEILEQAKLIYGRKNQLIGYLWGLKGRDQLERGMMELFWSSSNVLCLLRGLGDTDVCICQRSHKATLWFIKLLILYKM